MDHVTRSLDPDSSSALYLPEKLFILLLTPVVLLDVNRRLGEQRVDKKNTLKLFFRTIFTREFVVCLDQF